jgi:hypothetical protein
VSNECDKLMIKRKGCGRKRSLLNMKALTRHSPGGTEENHLDPPNTKQGCQPLGQEVRLQVLNNYKTTFLEKSITAGALEQRNFKKVLKINIEYRWAKSLRLIFLN